MREKGESQAVVRQDGACVRRVGAKRSSDRTERAQKKDVLSGRASAVVPMAQSRREYGAFAK
ncbi:MAG: hypothetical protein Rhims3KO_06720 [Hyphomicrobiales bacterium]